MLKYFLYLFNGLTFLNDQPKVKNNVLTILFFCVCSALASMVVPVWMELMPSPACVYLDSLAATASMISMSVTPNHVSMEVLVLTVMGRINAPVLTATQESTAR